MSAEHNEADEYGHETGGQRDVSAQNAHATLLQTPAKEEKRTGFELRRLASPTDHKSNSLPPSRSISKRHHQSKISQSTASNTYIMQSASSETDDERGRKPQRAER